jgi:hypothetical protein
MNNNINIKKVISKQLDIPNHKLIYIIKHKEYVKGIWETLHCYDIQYSKETHEILVEMIQEKLEGPNIEREWTKDEYQNLVLYRENE